MLETPLRVGVLGTASQAHLLSCQINITPGMDLAWQCGEGITELGEAFKKEPIDVFIEASENLELAAQAALLALRHNAHLITRDPQLEVTLGLKLQAEAYRRGLIISADIGTLHGTLASMIQEAYIMGFDLIQAGQICDLEPSPQLQYEMAALANGFALLPPSTGMSGPVITQRAELISAFDLESYRGQGHVDYVRCGDTSQRGPYLIVKARQTLHKDQLALLQNCQLGDGPYFLLHRQLPLGPFETPKSILAAAAGQATLSPAYPNCEVYADAQGEPLLLPYEPELIPQVFLEKGKKNDNKIPTLADHLLPDTPLTHLWIEQRKIMENQSTNSPK